MKKVIMLLLVLIVGVSAFTGCGGGSAAGGSATGKYALVSMVDSEGNDWLEMLASMAAMFGEEDESFDFSSLYLELKDGGKFVMSMMDEVQEGTYRINGKNITLTAEGEDISGTINGKKISLSAEEEGQSMTMVFEKK